MPASLQPKVWWVLIGTNDLAGGSGGGWGGICSAESVLVGIINIAKEIQANKVNATIVVNSILPRPGDQDSGKLYGSLWEDISWINDRLECFAQGVDGVEFFNATDLFLVNDTHINETRLPDKLHPSAEGARVWGMEIVKKVKELSAIQT
jgi:lysophospholipase L1-like esterase